MAEQNEESGSFIDRKRPAMEGLIQDLLGPVSRLDEIVLGKPVPSESAIMEETIQEAEQEE